MTYCISETLLCDVIDFLYILTRQSQLELPLGMQTCTLLPSYIYFPQLQSLSHVECYNPKALYIILRIGFCVPLRLAPDTFDWVEFAVEFEQEVS